MPINIRGANILNSSADETCPLCKGAGYVRVEVPVGHPNFGRLFPCECRTRDIEERNRRELLRLSNLDAFADKTFETFDPSVPGVREAYQRALEFAENPTGWLLLLGSCGVGKTHLAAGIAHRALSNNLTTFFTVVPDLLDHLRATFSPTSDLSYDELFDKVRTVPLLVLDDLGTENSTPWAVEKLYQLINHRYNYRIPTVITTNQDLDRMDRRIVSRLLDSQLVQHVFIEAADYRQRGRRGNVGRNRRR